VLLYSLLLAIARNLDGNSPKWTYRIHPQGNSHILHVKFQSQRRWNAATPSDSENYDHPSDILASCTASSILFSVWDQGPNPNAHYLLISWLHIQDWSIQSIIVLDFTVFCFYEGTSVMDSPEHICKSLKWCTSVQLWAKDNDPDLLMPQIRIADLTWLAFSDQMAGQNSVQGRAKTHIFVTSGSL